MIVASTERDTFAADLARFGPGALGPTPSLAESRAYCAQLARRHYENFVVASWLVPRALRPHFFSVYAYCRWADDLGDETSSPQEALALLDWWQEELEACYASTQEDCKVTLLPPGEGVERSETDEGAATIHASPSPGLRPSSPGGRGVPVTTQSC